MKKFTGYATSELAHLSPADQNDLICDSFENAWLRGETPSIEDFLYSCNRPLSDSLLVELLLLEREYLIRLGGDASRQTYQQRFPEYSTMIEQLDFSTIDERGEIRSLGTRNRLTAVPGDRLSHFELLESLGSGASGTVWKARDTSLRRVVALKLHREDRASSCERERFLREGQACAQLRHPNIVAVHEVGEETGRAFIVSEFIDGVDLRQWMEQDLPVASKAAEIVAQLAEALHHAHEQGVIHRDLKPANVLLDSEGHPHVTDFGLAKWTSNSAGITAEGNILGTPAYMSPEQARGEVSQVDRRTDVYGLGALLYEMLTGRPPFEGETPAVIHQVIHDEPPLPHSITAVVPRDLETICLKAIEKEPNCRYPSAQEMAVDLRRFLRGEPIIARPVGRLAKSWRWLRRRPAIAASLVLAFLAVGSLAIAGRYAVKNQELLGLRSVSLTTYPAGAKVAFVPLSGTTGEPDLSNATYASGSTPVLERLKPGDYFVVAVMSDGRFHEVYRHVPQVSESVTGAYLHRCSAVTSDGTVNLPRISIPRAIVSRGMALIEGAEDFTYGASESTEAARDARLVRSFYMDTTEYTIGAYMSNHKNLPREFQDHLLTDDFAISVDYEHAVAIAEDIGKRLPTEVEYEFAATNRGRSKYPWGDDFPVIKLETTLGPTKNPAFDCLDTEPAVYGLCSNKAEWTCSWPILHPPYPPALGLLALQERRVVRGGNFATVNGDGSMAPEIRDPRNRFDLVRYASEPGLGFRCVRSASPLIKYDEFP